MRRDHGGFGGGMVGIGGVALVCVAVGVGVHGTERMDGAARRAAVDGKYPRHLPLLQNCKRRRIVGSSMVWIGIQVRYL